jgi:hypothetical protein
MGRWEEFRRLGCHVVSSEGKNNMIQPLAIAKILGIPAFAVFDADGNDKSPQNARNNLAILRLSGVEEPEPFPTSIVRTGNVHAWPTKISSCVIEDLGEKEWSYAAARVRDALKIDVGNLQKNSPFIVYILTDAWENAMRSKELSDLCDAIIGFAADAREPLMPQVATEPKPQ